MPSEMMPILTDTHYARSFPEFRTLDDELLRRYGSRIQRLARRSSILRGVLAWRIAQNFQAVLTVNHHAGAFWLILLCGLAGQRKLLLLEFMIYPDRFLKRLILPWLVPLVLAPALRRSLIAAQVMLREEPPYYAKLLGIDGSRFRTILLPLWTNSDSAPATLRDATLVFSSGRAACDWEMLFRAADGAGWNLVVVCGRREHERVQALNCNSVATVLCEISPEEHAAWMQRAAVYVLPLFDRPISSGQLRIRIAISSGTPTVATSVHGLDGYAVNGETALLIQPGDAAALRTSVDDLLQHPQKRLALAQGAKTFASSRTEADFERALRGFVFQYTSAQPGVSTRG